MTVRTQVAPEVRALLQQANALRQANDLAGTVPPLEQAARLAPDNVHIQHDLGLTWLNLDNPASALPYLQRAVALDPNFGHAQLRLGEALEALSLPGAEDAYRRAIASTPDLAEAYGRLAEVRHQRGHTTEAIIAYRSAAQRSRRPRERGMYAVRAALLAGDLADAEKLLRQVLAINAEDGSALALLAYIQKGRGDFPAAEANFTAALRAHPSEVLWYHQLVQTRKIRPDDGALIDRMRTALATSTRPLSVVRLHMALAKALDDIGDYPAAATHLKAAGDLQMRHFPIDHADLAAQVDGWIALCTPAWLARTGRQGDPSECPILVLGMPRSGTTLVERILSCHRMVASGGELRFWQERSQEVLGMPDPASVDLRPIAPAFLARLRSVSADAARVVDKNPFNFIAAGLIHAVFPQARIVHCRRHPADTCLSVMLAGLIPTPFFSNAGNDLVFFYRQYLRIMAHYRSVLPPDRFMELDYEDLVTDPSKQIRSLILFCGLPWDSACLTPERNSNPIFSASVWQARQSIFRTSVGRHQHYKELLRPFEALSDGH
jgi:tetratricopeptide (TPR) repeat protein